MKTIDSYKDKVSYEGASNKRSISLLKDIEINLNDIEAKLKTLRECVSKLTELEVEQRR